MLIRGTELDGLVEKDFKLNGREQSQFLDFRYDMDLRDPSVAGGTNASPLGKDVTHVYFNAPAYGHVFEAANYPTVKKMFEALAAPEHYPMYLHCTYGADRTGTLVFLLQGLLGVSYDDMVFEYKLTALTFPDYLSASRLVDIHNKLSNFDGNTTSEKIENYLTKEVGVSESTIRSIKEIYLENEKN